VLAVCGAAAITIVTVGGSLGIGPGAAMASTTHTPAKQSSSEPSSSHDTAPKQDAASSSGDGSWLTIGEDRSGSGETPRSHPDPSGDSSTSSPAIPAGSGHGKRVVFDQSDQRVWLVAGDGSVARTYLVSGSKHDNLEPGTYEVYSKSRDAISFDGRETMGYMVRFAHGEHAPIGFHDIPRLSDGSLVETRDQLGTPLSAGCVRQWPPDAKALWDFAPVGTTVVVVA
jgi:lipoprotein-anchoring transpeptidase ErfK/SrfK